LVRTDLAAKKQEGISFLLIDMKSPGITVRPIATMDGSAEINEVFFDEVKVPVANLVGEENKGWDYAKYLLGHERTGIARVGVSKERLRRLKELAALEPAGGGARMIDDGHFRGEIAAVGGGLQAVGVKARRGGAGARKSRPGRPRSSRSRARRSSRRSPSSSWTWSGRMRCPTSPISTAATSRRSDRTTRAPSPPPTSTGARSRSTAAPTRSSATSSRRPSWGSEGMDFDLTEEQRLLQESVGKLVADEYHLEKRKGYAKEPAGYSEARWAHYAELGLLGLPFPERLGGSDGTPVETMIVMEAFGRGLVLEPYLATVILGGGFLRLAGSA